MVISCWSEERHPSRRGPIEVASFRWGSFFILVIPHVIAENRVHFVLGEDALRMVEIPELLAAGAGDEDSGH